MVQSYTSGDNDVIEIHEFSLVDIDAYLDIYFETLNNRLRHFIGDDEQLQQFRLATKNRITSDTNSREYQNVLLGKMNGEVVAAVTLSFPGETTTISNTHILPQASSCLTSIRRWMIRNANYIPSNMEECYIEMIGVKNPYRNHGIGAAMLECVEHFARQAGAVLLTVHISGDQLRNYFQRFGFLIENTDNSAFWKWLVERQSTQKMAKPISPSDENTDYPMDNTSSYINESMVGSQDE
jgi:GNAT superfamily N-acetyltransferase